MLRPALARSTGDRGFDAPSIPSGIEIRNSRIAPPKAIAPVTAPARSTSPATGVPVELGVVKPPRAWRKVRPRSPCSSRQRNRPYCT